MLVYSALRVPDEARYMYVHNFVFKGIDNIPYNMNYNYMYAFGRVDQSSCSDFL